MAQSCSGTCRACQKDINQQTRVLGGDEGSNAIVVLRSEDNHMDPCFRFPADDLGDLFQHATMVEGMLVALEHMQVNFVTISTTGLRKFRRNTLSFPQDIASFAQRMELMKNYRPRDRVNSSRGSGPEKDNPDREIRKAVSASAEDRERYAVDSSGALIIPGRVRERLPCGWLVVDYDHGGDGVERPQNVTPRVTMPWHPKHVPMHIMLRRNVGTGKGVVEGLEVRWEYVANLLQALCAYSRNGVPWRLGGTEDEPMHKYYDRRLFHVMDRDEILTEYAPKQREGVLLSETEVSNLLDGEKLKAAKSVVDTPQLFIAGGFDVTFVGPDADPTECGVCGQDSPPMDEELGAPSSEDVC